MRVLLYVLIAAVSLAGIVRLSKAASDQGAVSGAVAPALPVKSAQASPAAPAAEPATRAATAVADDQQPMLHVVRHKHYRIPGTGPKAEAKTKVVAEKAKPVKARAKHPKAVHHAATK